MPPFPQPLAAASSSDPYPYYRHLVTYAPLFRDVSSSLWIASSAETVMAVLAHPDCRVRPAAEAIPSALAASEAGSLFGQLVRMTDGDYQQRMKRCISVVFSSQNEGQIRQKTAQAAKLLGLFDDSRCLHARVKDAMFVLPVYVIALLLLGIESEALSAAVSDTRRVVRSFAPQAGTARVTQGSDAVLRLSELLTTPAVQSSSSYGLLLSQASAAGLNAQQITANAIGFLTQTFDACAGLIGNALLMWVRFSSAIQTKAMPPALWQAFIRETLRYDPPIQNTRRFTSCALFVAGCELRQGEQILVNLAAASRDPAVHDEPQRFDPQRTPQRLFTFGDGAHRCPASQLAVSIAASTLAGLSNDMAGLQKLTENHRYLPLTNARIPEFLL